MMQKYSKFSLFFQAKGHYKLLQSHFFVLQHVAIPDYNILFITLPPAHPPMQHPPPTHLLIEGLHRVLFQAVGRLLTALDKGFGRLLLVILLASRQQQGGQSNHCCRENLGCRRIFHGLSYYRNTFCLRNTLCIGNPQQVNALRQV